MTRDQAIEHGKEQLEIFGGDHREFIELAIQALEQEPILDKIRAEISEAMDMEPAWKGQDNYVGGLQIACSIIDKYRQEG